jgi:hypothetical protein
MKKKILVAVLLAALAAGIAVAVRAGAANAVYHDTKVTVVTH